MFKFLQNKPIKILETKGAILFGCVLFVFLFGLSVQSIDADQGFTGGAGDGHDSVDSEAQPFMGGGYDGYSSSGYDTDTYLGFGAATGLAFVYEPADAYVNQVIGSEEAGQNIAVKIVDAYGNTVETATDTIDLVLSNNPSGAALGGDDDVAATAGVATFSDLTINKPGEFYALTASVSGETWTSAVSGSFNVFSEDRF